MSSVEGLASMGGVAPTPIVVLSPMVRGSMIVPAMAAVTAHAELTEGAKGNDRPKKPKDPMPAAGLPSAEANAMQQAQDLLLQVMALVRTKRSAIGGATGSGSASGSNTDMVTDEDDLANQVLSITRERDAFRDKWIAVQERCAVLEAERSDTKAALERAERKLDEEQRRSADVIAIEKQEKKEMQAAFDSQRLEMKAEIEAMRKQAQEDRDKMMVDAEACKTEHKRILDTHLAAGVAAVSAMRDVVVTSERQRAKMDSWRTASNYRALECDLDDLVIGLPRRRQRVRAYDTYGLEMYVD